MDSEIIVKYVKIDGHTFTKPLPKFAYDAKTAHWTILVEVGEQLAFFAARQGQEIEVEVGTDFGALRDVGIVKTWSGELPDGKCSIVKVEGTDPMDFVEK